MAAARSDALNVIQHAFDPMFERLEEIPPLLVLAVFAVASALFLLLVFRLASSPSRMRRARDRAHAHLLEARIFGRAPGVFGRACGRLLLAVLAYLARLLVPLALMAVPIAIIIAQLNLRYASRPLLPGEPARLTIRTTSSAAAQALSVELPETLVPTAPLERAPAENVVAVRFESWRVGRAEIRVRAEAETVTKEVITGAGYPLISRIRMRGPLWRRLFTSAEQELPAAGPVDLIALEYPRRSLELGGLPVPWLAWYSVVALAMALVLRPVVGVEI
jgi:hypothetical protein